MKNEVLDDIMIDSFKEGLQLDAGEEIIWEGKPIDEKIIFDWDIIPNSMMRLITRVRMIYVLSISTYAVIGAYFWNNSDTNHLFIFSIKVLGFIFLLLCIPLFIDDQVGIKTNYIFTSKQFIFEFNTRGEKITRHIPLKEVNHVLIQKDWQGKKSGTIIFKLKEGFDHQLNFHHSWGTKSGRPYIGSIENVGEVFTLLQQYISKNKKA